MQTNAAIPPQAQSTYKSDMTAGHVRVGKRGVCLPPEAMAAVSGSKGCGAGSNLTMVPCLPLDGVHRIASADTH